MSTLGTARGRDKTVFDPDKKIIEWRAHCRYGSEDNQGNQADHQAVLHRCSALLITPELANITKNIFHLFLAPRISKQGADNSAEGAELPAGHHIKCKLQRW